MTTCLEKSCSFGLPRVPFVKCCQFMYLGISLFIIDFRFADDIVANAEEEEEAGVLVDRLDTNTTSYKMEIGPDKTKVMTNNPNDFQREVKIKGQMLEEVENLR